VREAIDDQGVLGNGGAVGLAEPGPLAATEGIQVAVLAGPEGAQSLPQLLVCGVVFQAQGRTERSQVDPAQLGKAMGMGGVQEGSDAVVCPSRGRRGLPGLGECWRAATGARSRGIACGGTPVAVAGPQDPCGVAGGLRGAGWVRGGGLGNWRGERGWPGDQRRALL